MSESDNSNLRCDIEDLTPRSGYVFMLAVQFCKDTVRDGMGCKLSMFNFYVLCSVVDYSTKTELTQYKLREVMMVDSSKLNHAVTDLENRGLIKRIGGEGRWEPKGLVSTDEGVKLVRQFDELLDKRLSRGLGLSESKNFESVIRDLRKFPSIVGRIYRGIRAVGKYSKAAWTRK